MMRTLRTRLGLVVTAAAIIAAPVIGAAGPAAAHNYIVDSTPAAGETLTEQPGVISVTTNDALLDFGSGSALEVSGPASAPLYYGTGCTVVSGSTLQTEAALGAAGTYTVTWQVVSTDGHPVSGTFDFEWAPAPGQELAEGSATPPACASAGATADPEAPAAPDAGGETPNAPAASVTDLLWIGGALVVVVAAVAVALFVVRRRGGGSSE